MQIKLDEYYLNVLIKGLYQQRLLYDSETNKLIDSLLLRLIDESKNLKPKRKLKLRLENNELSVIVKVLTDRRNQEIHAGNEAAVEVFGELLAILL